MSAAPYRGGNRVSQAVAAFSEAGPGGTTTAASRPRDFSRPPPPGGRGGSGISSSPRPLPSTPGRGKDSRPGSPAPGSPASPAPPVVPRRPADSPTTSVVISTSIDVSDKGVTAVRSGSAARVSVLTPAPAPPTTAKPPPSSSSASSSSVLAVAASSSSSSSSSLSASAGASDRPQSAMMQLADEQPAASLEPSKFDFTPDESLYKTRRDKIAKEILTTEISYVKSLEILIDSFLLPLDKEKMLGDADLRLLGFYSIQNIFKAHTFFLEKLVGTIGQQWSPSSRLGDAFKEYTPYLKMYREYTEAYEGALNKLNELMAKNVPFASFVKTWEESPKAYMLPLPSFLIMPVQRIPRYNLLLRDLLKETDEQHPDYVGLQKSLAEMETVAAYINDAIKAAESRRKMLSVQQSLVSLGSFDLIVPHRKFVKDGVLTKVCRRTDKERAFFLFNDGLLYADPVPASSKYRFRRFIPFRCLMVLTLPDDDDAQQSGAKKSRKNAFQILNDKKSFVVYAASADERNSWVNAIFDAQAQDQTQGIDGGEFSPPWMQDSETTRCLGCGDAFSFFNRRHHCRKCGAIFCSACTSKRVELAKGRKDRERVCNACFDAITAASGEDQDS